MFDPSYNAYTDTKTRQTPLELLIGTASPELRYEIIAGDSLNDPSIVLKLRGLRPRPQYVVRTKTVRNSNNTSRDASHAIACYSDSTHDILFNIEKARAPRNAS